MKKLVFLGDSREQLRSFPETARKNAGESLKLVQEGLQPRDWKSLVQIGKGIQEIRAWDSTGTYRVVYVARFTEAIYVLHAFQKKTQQTSKRDLDLIRRRYDEACKR